MINKLITLYILFLITSCSLIQKKENLFFCQKAWSIYKTQSKEALNLFNQCLKSGNLSISSTARTYRNIGITYNNLHDYEKAIEYFDRAILLKPEDVFNDYVNKGNSLDLLKKPKEALESYNKAIEESKICTIHKIKNGNHTQIFLRSSCGEIYYNRGVYYEGQKNYKKAIEDFKTSYDFGLRNDRLFQRFVLHKIDKDF